MDRVTIGEWGSRPIGGDSRARPTPTGQAPDFLAQARVRRERGAPALWSAGARRLRGFGKPIAIAWLLNVGLALVAAVPIYGALDDSLSRSRWASFAARRFDLGWFLDFQTAAKPAFAASHSQIVAAAVITLLASIFLSGGVLGRLLAGSNVSASTFLADCARYFGRFASVFVFASALAGVVLWIFVAKRPAAFDVWLRYQPSDLFALGAELVVLAVLVWLLAWIHMAQDIARLAIVVHGRSPLPEFVRGLGIAFRNFDTLAGLYVWTLLLGAIVSLVYLPLSHGAHGLGGRFGTIALLVLVQLYMWVRIWLGFGLTAALLTWYERRFPPS
jgi:hypothetical protein